MEAILVSSGYCDPPTACRRRLARITFIWRRGVWWCLSTACSEFNHSVSHITRHQLCTLLYHRRRPREISPSPDRGPCVSSSATPRSSEAWGVGVRWQGLWIVGLSRGQGRTGRGRSPRDSLKSRCLDSTIECLGLR